MQVSEAPQYENALHQHEILLRSSGIRSAGQISELRDQFDSIDLTDNHMSELKNDFPNLPRLKVLFLNQNRIRQIDQDVAHSFPNLTTLSLANNFIADPEELGFLRLLPKITHLCLMGNPITDTADYRSTVIKIQPRLRFLDFERVSEKERQVATSHKTMSAEAEKRHAELLVLLENATSIEEIDAIEQELAQLAEKD